MTVTIGRLLSALCFTLAAVVAQAQQGLAADVRVALVIGNGAYASVPQLGNPVRDAAKVAAMLRGLGFQTVLTASDLTHDGMLKALRTFDAAAEGADWAVIYYAGHGLEVGGVNYLVPIDAALQSDKDVPDEAVSLERVMSSIESARKLRIVILDACRNNPFADRMKRTGAARSVGRGLARVEPDAGMLVAFAAREGQTALDGDGTDSPFVGALVRRIAQPGVEISKVFRQVRDDVLATTKRRQEPAIYSSLPGEDFFFVAPGGVASAPARPSDPVAPETATPPAPLSRDTLTPAEAPQGTLAERFAALAKSGGLVVGATSAPELYHNARVEEARGDSAAARKDYLALAAVASEAVDPHLRFAALLRAEDGRAGAREVYARLQETTGGRAAALVYALQFDGDERRKRLEAFAAANPAYGPAQYYLADDYSEARLGTQTLSDKRQQMAALDRFLELDRDGKLVPSFLDQSVLSDWLDQARKQQAALQPFLMKLSPGPVASFMRSNSGWTVSLSLPEPAVELWYRVGDAGDFVSTGTLAAIDPRTGRPMPNPSFELDPDASAATIQVRYDDASGRRLGPFPIAFDPRAALVREQRDVLDRFWTSWIAFGSGDPRAGLLYFTQLISYRCAIVKAQVGFDDGPLSIVLPLPPCDERAPMKIPNDVKPYMTLPKGTKSVSVQLTYADATHSDKKVFKVK